MLAAMLHPDSSDQCSFPSGLAVRATGNFVSRFKLFRSGKNTPLSAMKNSGQKWTGSAVVRAMPCIRYEVVLPI